MRSRNIKPGFFQNEYLAELSTDTRLLFIGLWLIADRDGRLEDRPKKIKMQVFPADSFDVDPMLNDLTRFGLIIRYEIDSIKYIAIPAWNKHQNPHVKEKESTIPAPDLHGSRRVITEASPADSLIPDSLDLIPDSGSPSKHPSASPTVVLVEKTPSRFEEWWLVYPVKKGKKPCMAKWKARKLDKIADTLIADVLNRIENDTDWKRGFIKHPTTYLNQDSWEDEIQTRMVDSGGKLTPLQKLRSDMDKIAENQNAN